MKLKDIKKQSISLNSKPIKKDFFGEAPSVFVGRFGYPNVNIGIVSPPEQKNTQIFDSPRSWALDNFNQSQVIDLRSQLVNSRFVSNIKSNKDIPNKFLELTKELAMAKIPTDIEINLKKSASPKTHLYNYSAPTGPNAELKKIQITQNTKISQKVEKTVDATDLKASDAINYLFTKNFDENFLSKLLSVGNLGIKDERKLVPSRWSVTATDDIIGKQLIEQIKDNKESNYTTYFGNYMGNYWLILVLPEPWSYEIFEMFIPQGYSGQPIEFTTDYENTKGRKSYAHNVTGGYYANRLPILQHLKRTNRQGSVISFRFITSEYQNSLGVWVVRESTRKTLNSRSIQFASKELLLKYAKILIKKHFNYDLDKLLKRSKILTNNQTRLTTF